MSRFSQDILIPFTRSLTVCFCLGVLCKTRKQEKIARVPFSLQSERRFKIRKQCKSFLNCMCVSPGKTTFKLLNYYLAKHWEIVFVTIDDDFKLHIHKNNGVHVTVVSPLYKQR